MTSASFHPQAQLEAAHAATAAATSDASRAQHEARAAAAQLAAAGAERDAAQAELRQLTHMYQQHLATQWEEMAAVVAASSAAHTPSMVGGWAGAALARLERQVGWMESSCVWQGRVPCAACNGDGRGDEVSMCVCVRVCVCVCFRVHKENTNKSKTVRAMRSRQSSVASGLPGIT